MHVDGPVIRGNERQAIRVAAGLRGRGHDVAVSCRTGGAVQAELDAAGVRTTGVRPGGDADLWNAARFGAWLRRERPDAVLLTSWKRAFGGVWTARAAGVPRVLLRMGGVHPLRSPVQALLKGGAMRRGCDAVIANSRAVAEHLVDAVGVPSARVVLVHNGIDRPPPALAGLRDDLGIPPGAVLAAAVGGMERIKGFDLLIEALGRAPGVHAVLVGGGSEGRRRMLAELAEARGVAGRVHFLGRRGDAASVAAACDLFVLPSRSEGMSVAMMEAMAAGVPVVGAAVGGAWDALGPVEGRPPGGWIVPAGDAAALGRAIAGAASDLRAGGREAQARAAEAGWRMRNWFTLERMLDGYEAALRGVRP